jgi:hypothetical protein
MSSNPKGLSDRTLQVLQLGTQTEKMLALLRTYSLDEVIDVLPHLASTGYTGEQFTALRGAVQAHLDGELLKQNVSALQRVNSEQIAALKDLHEKHVAELQKMSAAQVAAVNRLNTSTTFLSVMAIVCTVILGVISLATSCRVSLITPPPNIALQRTPGVGAPDAAVPVRRGDDWLTEQRVDFDTGG